MTTPPRSELAPARARSVRLGTMRGLAAMLLLTADCGGDDGPASCPVSTAVGSCQRDSDCVEEVCARASGADGDSRVALACAPAGTDAPRCETPTDCSHGLCLASGRCAEPCVTADDCAAPDASRCMTSWLRDGAGEFERGAVCAPQATVAWWARSTVRDVRALSLLASPEGSHHVLVPRCQPSLRPVSLHADGEVVYDPAALAPQAAPPANAFYAPFPGPLAILLPNNDRYLAWDRAHEVTLQEASDVDVFTFAPSGGDTLDLDVYLVGVALEEPALATALSELDERLRTVGLQLGDVRRHWIGGELGSRLAVLDGDRGRLPELGELFSLSAGALPGVPVFLVRHIDFFLAIGGGVPGPMAVPGTSASGIAIGADDAGDALGAVLAHELGHFLGLFHLIEPDGSTRENLSDTPRCDLMADSDADGVLTAAECDGLGAQNLMFWSLRASGSPPGQLSAGQGAVARTAPILR